MMNFIQGGGSPAGEHGRRYNNVGSVPAAALSDSLCRQSDDPVHSFQAPPEAARRDRFAASGGCGPTQGDCSRGPISIDPVHDGKCHLADVDETVFVPSSLGPTGLAGFGRQASFFPAHDGAPAKVIRREPHWSCSVIRSTPSVEQKVCAECRKVLPKGRTLSRAKP